MKRLLFALIVTLVSVGCGEDSDNPLESSDSTFSITIDNITTNPPDKFGDYQVVIEFTVENLSSESLPLNIWLEDSDENAIYYRYNEITDYPYFVGSISAPDILLPGGKVNCKMFTRMSDTLYQIKKAKGPYKLVVSDGVTRRVAVDLPSWEEIKSRLTSMPPNTSFEPEPADFTNIKLAEYFPLEVGNSWSYDIMLDDKIIWSYIDTVSQIVTLEGADYYQVDRGQDLEAPSAFGSLGYYSLSDNVILRKITKNIESYIYLNSKMIIGQPRLTIPAGTFKCIKIERKLEGAEPIYEYYGKGVGLVMKDYGIMSVAIDSPATPIRGRYVYLLKSYTQ